MNEIEKREVLDFIRTMARDHPDVVSAMYAAIQAGLNQRLEYEMDQRQNAVTALVCLWDVTDANILKRWRNKIKDGISTLVPYYAGTPFGARVERWLKEGESDENTRP